MLSAAAAAGAAGPRSARVQTRIDTRLESVIAAVGASPSNRASPNRGSRGPVSGSDRPSAAAAGLGSDRHPAARTASTGGRRSSSNEVSPPRESPRESPQTAPPKLAIRPAEPQRRQAEA